MLIPELSLKKIKKSIRNERVAINLSQKEFSEFIDMKYSTYRNFEQNGIVSLTNFLLILNGLNKDEEFEKFMSGFEYQSGIHNQRADKNTSKCSVLSPIIDASQKQIVLDKNIFGNELFYSVDNGHVYDVSKFIAIMLKNANDKQLMLLLKYFGEKRLKPYILRERNINLLKKFNNHISYINKDI